jgi:pimeloyl-ACP methyl ester carboxylesterase
MTAAMKPVTKTLHRMLAMIDGILFAPAQLRSRVLCSLSTKLPGALQHGNIADHAAPDQPDKQRESVTEKACQRGESMVDLEIAPRARCIRFSTPGAILMAMAMICIITTGFETSLVANELDDSQPAAAIELREGLAISSARARRATVDVDPIAAQVVAGKWAMPRSGDSVTFPGGQTKKWESVKAGADGWFSGGALRGGYLAMSFSAPEASVMMLEAAGHGMVYVDGEPRAGDLYSNGYVHLPVRVRKGQNVLLFQVGRGRLKAKLTKPTATAFFSTADVTIPDLIAGEPVQCEAAVLIVNATEASRDDLAITSCIDSGQETRSAVPALVPLSARKVAFELRGTSPSTGETAVIELKLEQKAPNGDRSAWKTLDSTRINLRVRQSGQTFTRTFRSSIDGSLQYYSVVPALPGPAQGRPGIILTLHGAGVEGIGQAQCYSRKPGTYVIAPTNRRPYGFDWEDWGRLDAIEVLEHAQRTFQTDPQQTYLTGHSMGGHGTWHLGVTFPDRFAAIAPSAGWISMWSYAGAKRTTSASPIDELMARALGPSDTLALSRNLARLGVYILHGDADDNVPVGQARQMRHALGEFHPDFAYHEQPGAGHWWGNPCVDWPPLIAFLADHKIPAPDQVRKIDFITASPAVSSRAHWLSIDSQLKALLPSTVHIELEPEHRRFRGTTENVARLALDLRRALPNAKDAGPIQIEIDGQKLSPFSSGATPADGDRSIWLVRTGGTWSFSHSPPPSSRKGPARQGPFKEAFRNRFILVYATKGTPAENAWSLARARFDAEVFWYRGNGSVDIVSDARFLEPAREHEFRNRNVILYGHAENNAAWPVLLGASPIQVSRGKVKLGARTVSGDDLACLFVRPRPGTDQASVAVVSGSGLTGLRFTERLSYFTSGVAYPDCTVFKVPASNESSPAPIAAGYFGADWDVESGEFAWAL